MAQAEVFAPDEVAVVHVMNRVVPRCDLLGDNPVSGKERKRGRSQYRSALRLLCGLDYKFRYFRLDGMSVGFVDLCAGNPGEEPRGHENNFGLPSQYR
jgi:hypothetical protein